MKRGEIPATDGPADQNGPGALKAELAAFIEGAPQRDDITVIGFRIKI